MKKLILFAAATLALTACVEDSRNNYMVDDSLSLAYEENIVPVSVYAGSRQVTILKSGKGTIAASATVGTSSEALLAYNNDEANEYTFREIDASLVSFSQNRVSFEPKDVRQTITVSWDPQKLIPELDGESSAIPVSILEADIDVNRNRSLLLLNLLNSTVSFASSGSSVTARENAAENQELSVKIRLDHAIPSDLTVRLAVDNSLVETYNLDKGTHYGQAPDGYVNLYSATIKGGTTDVFTTVTLQTSALFNGGEMMNFRTLVVPIRITEASQEGLLVSDKVYYLLVNSPYAGASVSRIWGKYSIESLWMTEYGLPSGGDRNLALDGEWVYLPYAVGGNTAQITAISVDDPSVTKQVNCTGFKTATITSACVRVIDKGDGSRMLVASGAAENDFPFYAWENGIDNPPTVYSLQCTWRRGGDRFEFHGSWADGTLYVHSYQGTFTTSYKVTNGAFVKTDRTLVDVPYTGFGGFYAYPGQDQMVFTSSDASAFITITGTTHPAGDGQDIWDTAREAFDGADLSWGYRCFTYRGEKYIAYTTIDKDDDLKEDGVSTYTTRQRARLVIVKDKGGFKVSLDGENQDIIFEAPLQGEEFTDIALAPPVSAQGDCAVVAYGDKVIIAAGVQGLGLSVFKME